MGKLDTEFVFSASKSSGPGGQNVNKVNTKAELRFNVEKSKLLLPDEKELILKNLKGKLTKKNELVITSTETRSLIKNKKICIKKIYKLLDDAQMVKKLRGKFRPSKARNQERLNEKKINSQRKQSRKNDFLE